MSSNFSFYRSLIARRMPVMALLIIVFSAAGIVAALRLPPTYEASARLIVETPQIPDELAASTVRISAAEEIEFIRQRLLTRANLIDIQDEFKVLGGARGISADTIVEEMLARTSIINTQGGAVRGAGPTLVTVSFKAPTGDIAARVVNEFVTRIITENISIRTDTAEDTLSFFEQEVARLGDELSRKSTAISEFQRENSDALPDDLNYRQGRLALLQERIASAERERTALIEQKSRIQTAFERTGGVNPTQQPIRLSPEQQELEDLESRLRQALTIYSENNPNVVALRNRIDALRSQVSGPTEEPVEQLDTAEIVLELQMSEIDSRIASLSDEITSTEAIVVDLADSVSRTPNVAVTLDALNRDYENVRLQYDNAVQSLSQANMGERIELTSRGQRITLIEPASVPSAPSSPNRPVVAAGGIGLGLGAAIGFFLLLELLNTTIRRPSELINKLDITPLATVPYIESPARKVGRRLFKVALIVATVVGVLAGLYLIDRYYMPLEFLVQRALNAAGL